ncbi:hypothetical protein WHR41_02298 [Cladosporium halotolerans]|uniref:Uncharacterized protein n=1 Tax=Cladosporium halotolerans TaxID=1052096 RepID=A0AB34KZV6_9PEZI
MPRNGDGSADNVVDTGAGSQAHGVAANDPASSGVDRSNKAAAPPAPEKGGAIEGMNASGGGNTASGSGKVTHIEPKN